MFEFQYFSVSVFFSSLNHLLLTDSSVCKGAWPHSASCRCTVTMVTTMNISLTRALITHCWCWTLVFNEKQHRDWKHELLTEVWFEARESQQVRNQTTLPRNPQTHSINKTKTCFICEWEKQQTEETAEKHMGRGIMGNNWSVSIISVQTHNTTSCLHRKSAERIMGSCHHHLQPFLWQTPDPAARAPDAPERTTNTHRHKNISN